MTENTELKRLAEAAPEGPWYQHGGIKQVLNHDCETVCETFEEDGDCPTARFIAAANPTAVLALIAENERLRENPHIRSIRSLRGDCADLMAERDQLRAEVSGLKTGYEAYEQVNAELMGEVEGLRKIISDSATSCGAAVSVECTLEFMKRLPVEIFSVISKLRNALAECADSLHGEMLQKFGGQLPDDMHPVTRREYDRDMAEVAGYRVALGLGEQS